MQSVSTFLINNGLESYIEKFRLHELDDLSLLQALSTEEIKDMAASIGMKIGAQMKFRRALAGKSRIVMTGKRKFMFSQNGNQNRNFSRGSPKFKRTEFRSQGRQVFISNLQWDSRWKDLKALCQEYGDVIRVTLERKPDGASKGSAIVLFKKRDAAQKCIRGIQGVVGKELDGRKLYARVDKFEGKPQIGNEKRVFVGNLPFLTNLQTLKQLCMTYGQCHVDIPTDDQNRSKGFGTIEFVQVSSAFDCVQKLHGQMFLGRRLMVKFDNLAPHFGTYRQKQEIPTKSELDQEIEAYATEGDSK